MARRLCISFLVFRFVSGGALFAGERHHHKWEWLVSGEERAKYNNARNEAMKTLAVISARERKKKADEEYRSLLKAEMLKIDPSLGPLLDKVSRVEKRLP